jgi:hypothetical protein
MGACVSVQRQACAPAQALPKGKARAPRDKGAGVQHVTAAAQPLPAQLAGWTSSGGLPLLPTDLQLSQEAGSLRIKSQSQGAPPPRPARRSRAVAASPALLTRACSGAAAPASPQAAAASAGPGGAAAPTLPPLGGAAYGAEAAREHASGDPSPAARLQSATTVEADCVPRGGSPPPAGAWSGAGLSSGGASFAQTPPWQRPDGAPGQPPGSEPWGCRRASAPNAAGTLDAALALRRASASAGPAHASSPGVAAAQLGAAPSESMLGVAPSDGPDDNVDGPERGQSLESGGSQSLPAMVPRERWVRARTRTTTEAPDGASHALPPHLHPHQAAALQAAWGGGTQPEAGAGGSGEAAGSGGEAAGDGGDAGGGGGGGAAASAAAFLSAFDALGAFDALTGLQPDPEGAAAAPAAAPAQRDLHAGPAGRAEAGSAPAAPPPGTAAATRAPAPELAAPPGAAAPLRAPDARDCVLAADRLPAAAPASGAAGAAPAMRQAPPGTGTAPAAQGAPAAAGAATTQDGPLIDAPAAPTVTALPAAHGPTLATHGAPAADVGALVTLRAPTAAADAGGAAALPPARGAHKPHKVPAAPGAR